MLLGNNLSYRRRTKVIFENINISASPGKIVFIKGINGSGKTTLLKTILNILEPNTGEVYWMGEKIKKNIFNLYKDTTFIMDKTCASLEMTIKENLIFWKKISQSKLNYQEIIKLIQMLELNEHLNEKTTHLSLGETKKLELTRLIIEQKKLWVLDEPYIGLDNNATALINETFIDHTLNEGIIIFASHYDPGIRNMETISLD